MKKSYSQALVFVGALIWIVGGCTSGDQSETRSGPDGGTSRSAAGFMPEGAVLPSPETIESGEYAPLSRPLFLYVRQESLKRPEVVAFLNYYISQEGQELVPEVGYVKLSEDQFASVKKVLDDAVAAAGTVVPADVTGEIEIDGSSTVYPVSQAVVEEFNMTHRNVRIPVARSGTGGGMKRFYAGEIDICNASRTIRDSEIEECSNNGIEFIELKVGVDGLTVVVNPENDWVSGMTISDLKRLWEPESSVTKWSDLNPEFPDEEIKLFGPDTDSGTFDYFSEEVCGEKGASRADYQQNADDNFLVTGVAGDKYALGYFGYAYYVENQGRLKALGIVPVE